MESSFRLYVSYSQIAVFLANIEQPFNDWEETHVKQGFAWREGSVSFRSLDADGYSEITVTVEPVPTAGLLNETIRAVEVPFCVGASGVEISSITESKLVNVPAGEYRLTFETGRHVGGQMWCYFRFTEEKNAPARVLRADSELSPSDCLLMTASPA